MPPRFRVIAHRGASAHAPENTLPAFGQAIALGADEVELDVRFSADDELIVFHDDSLDAKTNLSGRVRDHPADVIRGAEIGSWFDATHPGEASHAGTTVADLDTVLAILRDRVRYHIEIKDSAPGLPSRLLDLVREHALEANVMITSFSMAPLEGVRSLAGDIPIGLLLRDRADARRGSELRPALQGLGEAEIHEYWIDAAAEAGFEQVGVRAPDLEARTVARAADRGIDVRGWGVRGEKDLLHLLRLGAVGATVDWPGRALAAVARAEATG